MVAADASAGAVAAAASEDFAAAGVDDDAAADAGVFAANSGDAGPSAASAFGVGACGAAVSSPPKLLFELTFSPPAPAEGGRAGFAPADDGNEPLGATGSFDCPSGAFVVCRVSGEPPNEMPCVREAVGFAWKRGEPDADDEEDSEADGGRSGGVVASSVR